MAFIRHAAAAILLAVIALGINPGTASAQNRVSIGLVQEPPGLDPTVRTAAIINYVSMMNIFEGLTRLEEDGSYAPNLATRWESSTDGLTYTFHLLPGVKFADGSDMTSADVKWTFERNKAPDSQNNNKKYFDLMERIETPDPHTVVIHLKEPSSMLLHRLGWGGSSIVSPKTAATNITNPIGTGAFMLDNWVKGGAIRLKRNPYYRDPAKVKLQTVTFTVIQDPSAQVAALQAGDIDLLPQLGAPESVQLFEANPNLRVLRGASESEVILGMNNARKPFTDRRVRRAVMLAIDRRQAIQAGHFGFGTPIGSHFSINHPAYVDLTDRSPFDPAAARKLLAEAGLADGFSATLKLPDLVWTHRVAEVLQSDLRKVGIDLRIEKYQWAQWLDAVFRKRDYDMSLISHVDPMDIANYSQADYFYNYDSKEFQQIWRKVETSATEAEQYAAMRQAQEFLADDVPVAFLYHTANITVARKGLQGIWKSLPHYIADMTTVYWAR